MIVEIFTELDSMSRKELENMIQSLPEWRREVVMRYHFERDRKLSTVAYVLLREALRKGYNITHDPKWGYKESAKPFFVDYPDIHFNLSHCKRGVVCVVDSEPIGVDIEDMDNFDLDVARHIANDDEYHKIIQSSNPATAFTELWTQKESYLKYTGTGLTDNLKGLFPAALPIIITTTSIDSYSISICKKHP